MAKGLKNISTPVFEEETELLAAAVQEPEGAAQEPATGEPSVQGTEGKEGKRKMSWSRQILGGEMLTTRKALRLFPLIVLIIGCSILLVSNRYRVERLRKEIVQTRKHIDELSLQQIELKSEYQQSIKISNISSTLDSIGIHLVTEPPLTLHGK